MTTILLKKKQVYYLGKLNPLLRKVVKWSDTL